MQERFVQWRQNCLKNTDELINTFQDEKQHLILSFKGDECRLTTELTQHDSVLYITTYLITY